METTYELIRAARGFTQGKSEDLWHVYELSLDDIFFQMQFVMCEEKKITENLEAFYINLASSAFAIGKPEEIAQWLNESVQNSIQKWMSVNRKSMLEAEERGIYKLDISPEGFVSGQEADDIEYTRAIEKSLCKLPEIHRQTAVAYYYDDLSMDTIEEIFMVDSSVINSRIAYIERFLGHELAEFCREHRYQLKNINSQRIRSAMIELASLYRYPYAEALYENIRVKAVH